MERWLEQDQKVLMFSHDGEVTVRAAAQVLVTAEPEPAVSIHFPSSVPVPGAPAPGIFILSLLPESSIRIILSLIHRRREGILLSAPGTKRRTPR